jgi:hypothetical protein
MSRVYPLDPTVPGSLGVVRQTEAVAAAVAAILAGRLVVLPTETWVADQTKQPTLVLSACTPRFSASHRLVVFAARQ